MSRPGEGRSEMLSVFVAWIQGAARCASTTWLTRLGAHVGPLCTVVVQTGKATSLTSSSVSRAPSRC